MAREIFKNLPDTSTPLNASKLNGIFNGEESMGSIVVEDITCKNLLDESLLIKGLISISTGLYGANDDACCIDSFIEIDNTKNYVFSWSFSDNANAYVIFYDENKAILGNLYQQASKYSLKLNTFEKYSSAKYVKFRFDTLITNKIYLQLEKGSIATDYTPHKKFGYNSTDSMGKIIVDDIECKNLLYTPYNENNKLTLTAKHDDYYGVFDFRCYLEAGTTYTFTCETSATTFGCSASQVQVMLFLNKEATTVINMGQKRYTFVPTVSGLYYLRCDVNVSGDTQSFWNFQIEKGSIATDYVEHKEYENTTTKYTPSDYKSDDITISTTRLIKKNNRVVFRFNIIGTFVANTSQVIFTLPSELAPTSNAFFPIVAYTGGTSLNTGYASISTNGEVSVKTSLASNGLIANLVYDVD